MEYDHQSRDRGDSSFRGRGRDIDQGGRDRDFDRGGRDQDRGGRDQDRGRYFDRGRDSDRGRDFDRGRDHDRRDRGRPSYDSDRGRSRDEDRSRDDRSRRDDKDGRPRDRDNSNVNQKPSATTQQNGGEDERKAKRSRWSNDPESMSSTGLDDASKKLAKNTALEIAAKFANLAQVPENETSAGGDNPAPAGKPQEVPPQEPEKPVIDITKADTADIANNVLGQLDDDDYDDDEEDVAPQIKAPQPVVEKSAPVPEPVPVTVNNDINTNGSMDTSEPVAAIEPVTDSKANEITSDKPNSELPAPVQGEENS